MEGIQLQDKLFQVGSGSFHDELMGVCKSTRPWTECDVITVDDYDESFMSTKDIPRGSNVVIGVGKIHFRSEVARDLSENSFSFPQIISDRFLFIGEVTIGKGLIALGYGTASANAIIGDFCIIHGFAVIGHDVVLGDFVNVGAGAFLGGNVAVGNSVSIGPNSTILPGVKIGDGADVAAGSVVLRNVPAGARVYGNPAKKY